MYISIKSKACYLNRHLLVQGQQWKHQRNEGNLFKVDKDTRTTVECLFLKNTLIFYMQEELHYILA